jgi:hypothetical protein
MGDPSHPLSSLGPLRPREVPLLFYLYIVSAFAIGLLNYLYLYNGRSRIIPGQNVLSWILESRKNGFNNQIHYPGEFQVEF